MILEEEGRLDIDRPVRDYLPEFDAADKAGITVRMLLTHTGGLEAFAPLWRDFRGRDEYLRQINARPAENPPGEVMRYSDWDFVLLGLIIERITGQPLDAFLRERVWQPLGMRDTDFTPDESLLARIAPTEIDTLRGGLVHGFVHDENAWALGGVAGHAGLFSTVHDLSRFAAMLVNGGELDGVRIFQPETIARFTERQFGTDTRALGWDTPDELGRGAAGLRISRGAFGHTGFTGTSLWVDPDRGTWAVLLSNRTYQPRARNRIQEVRRVLNDLVAVSVDRAADR